MSTTTYMFRLSTEGGLLSTDWVTAEDALSSAELVRRREFGRTPASDGDIISIKESLT